MCLCVGNLCFCEIVSPNSSSDEQHSSVVSAISTELFSPAVADTTTDDRNPRRKVIPGCFCFRCDEIRCYEYDDEDEFDDDEFDDDEFEDFKLVPEEEKMRFPPEVVRTKGSPNTSSNNSANTSPWVIGNNGGRY